MMTTGMPLPDGVRTTGARSAVSSSGASTMPDTPRLMKSSTTLICASRSSSLSGPFQMISTSQLACRP